MGGEWSASRPGRALPPGKGPSVPIVQDAGWAPEPAWTQRLEEKSSASVGDRTPVVQSVVRHCTDRATPAPVFYKAKLKSNGDKAFPCCRSFWVGNVSSKCLPYRPQYLFNLNTFQVAYLIWWLYRMHRFSHQIHLLNCMHSSSLLCLYQYHNWR
jgi:hypothetical protein